MLVTWEAYDFPGLGLRVERCQVCPLRIAGGPGGRVELRVRRHAVVVPQFLAGVWADGVARRHVGTRISWGRERQKTFRSYTTTWGTPFDLSSSLFALLE